MPAFLSFFSKRDSSAVLRKSPQSSSLPSPSTPTSLPPTSSTKSFPSPSIADASEQLESSELSLEAEYVLADAELSPVNSNVVYPLASNGASTSTTKLKMPFRRRQQSTSNKLTSIPSRPPTVPPKEHKFLVESSVSDPPSLLPPPSRSAIFGSYADPHSASSTRSLPQGVPAMHPRRSSHDVPQLYETMSDPDSHTPFTTPQSKQPSKGGLFFWARPRARTKSKPSLPNSSLSSAPVLTLPPPDSFNLKAFRHVTSPAETSPSGSPSESDLLPRPRSRGGSHASEASQRISVAAFREAQAQARRSATNSPAPSVPGDRDSVPPGQVRNPRRSAFGTPPAITKADSQPRSSLPSTPPMRSPPARSSTAPLSFSASLSITSSESSEEEESESEEEATLRPRRRRTITSRSAQSEAGFRSSPILSYGAARSDIGHGVSSGLSTRPSPSPRSNVNNSPNPEASGSRSRTSSVYSRSRVSLSTSALVPEIATKRASAVSRYPAAVSRPTHPSPRSRSRASTSSESSSESCSSEDAPLALLQRPGSALSRGSGPSRRPTKPLVDIGQLVGENSALPPRASEPSNSSQLAAESDPPAARYRKTSLGLGERLSAIASGLGGLQPSRSKSPELTANSRDEAFTPPEIPEKPRSESPIPSPPIIKPVSSALKSKTNKSSSAKSFATPKLDTVFLKHDSGISPPSSSTSSDAPIPHITPTPIRERQELPAFAVTSRPISHASNPSAGTLAALDKAIADMDMDSKPAPRRSVSAMVEQPKEDQQQQRRQPQEDSQTTVRVVRSAPLKSPREESLPVPPPRSRARPPPTAVTVSNVHLTPPSALRQVSSSGAVVPPRRPFALRDSSPASSAGDSSSSRMPITPRDGSELGAGPTGRTALHRKRVSVTFVDEIEGERERRERERESRRPSVGKRPGHGRGPPPVVSSSSDDEDTARDRERAAEEKRRERRRSEAKAAIELGNVINGTGPIDDDDDDDDDGRQPMNVPPRMSMAMGMGTGMNTGNNIPFPTGLQSQWGAGAANFGGQLNNLQMQNFLNAGAGSGLPGSMDPSAAMNMGVGMVDPRVFAVHQQAMMIAKQTYQLAVAQQAMRDAADEWERGSAVSGWTGGRSSASTPNILNMGMGMNMGGGGMGGYPGAAGSFAMSGAGNMWPGGAIPGYPGNSARQMYSGNYAASEVGGGGGHRSGGGGGGWATSSVYGESFGAPRDRPSRAPRQSTLVQMSSSPLGSGSGSGGSAVAVKGGRPRTRTAPSSGGNSGGQRAGPSPAAANSAGGPGPGHVKKREGSASGGYGLVGAVSPPSSWKAPSQ